MGVKFFGQYLQECGIISRDSYIKAKEFQKQNLRFGELAVAMGFVTEKQVTEALNRQRCDDAPIGELLVACGALTADHVRAVKLRQDETTIQIGEALVLIGAMTVVQLQKCLAEFTHEQAPYRTDHVELPENVPNGRIWSMAADLTFKMVTRVLGLTCCPEPGFVTELILPNDTVAMVRFSGGANARYLLSVPRTVRDRIATSLLQLDTAEGEPLEVLQDSVGEFVNIVCGNVTVKASQLGKDVQISPPVLLEIPEQGMGPQAGEKAVSFPIHLEDGGDMELIICVCE